LQYFQIKQDKIEKFDEGDLVQFFHQGDWYEGIIKYHFCGDIYDVCYYEKYWRGYNQAFNCIVYVKENKATKINKTLWRTYREQT